MPDKNSKLIIFGNTAFATNLQTYSDYAILDYNNKDILLNSISYLTEREDNITIRKSSELIPTYNLTEFQSNAILDMKLASLTSLEINKLKEETQKTLYVEWNYKLQTITVTLNK